MKFLRNLSRLLFSRGIISVLVLMIQILIIFFIYHFFLDYIFYFYGVSILLSIVVVIQILNSYQNPAFQLSWIILVLALPVFGIFMYLWVSSQYIPKKLGRRLNHLHKKSLTALENANIDQVPVLDSPISNYLSRVFGYRTFFGDATYFPSGEDFFPDFLEELKKAEKFIFLEFFIIERGHMWNSVLEILKEKVKNGVEVRLLYDGTCSISLLPLNYPEVLESFGISCLQYSPIRPFISTYHNNRDHRKIVVIDGAIGYTGGINLADEYINEKVRFGYWKDAAIKIKGNAVNTFTTLFLEMWNLSSEQQESIYPYLVNSKTTEKGMITPYGDHPYDREEVSKNVYLDLIHRARKYIHIMTPYLVLDNELLSALKLAAKEGLEVVIMMPHIPDKQYTYLLARSYYAQLLQAGVKIYEFTSGFVHAKNLIVDGEFATVGSVNFDYRSLYLNYECGCLLQNHKCIKKIEKDFSGTIKMCQEITFEKVEKYPIFQKIYGKVLRLFAPLM